MIRMIPALRRFLMNEAPRHLGRWNLDYCHVRINRKIDYANEDHCGSCSNGMGIDTYDDYIKYIF
jgi:hypothetical protein